jgi:hypothetical protein
MESREIERVAEAVGQEVEQWLSTQQGYFENNALQMRDVECRQKKFFVGSGVVEASCRTVIGRRLKQSGMRWSVRGANAIVALPAFSPAALKTFGPRAPRSPPFISSTLKHSIPPAVPQPIQAPRVQCGLKRNLKNAEAIPSAIGPVDKAATPVSAHISLAKNGNS